MKVRLLLFLLLIGGGYWFIKERDGTGGASRIIDPALSLISPNREFFAPVFEGSQMVGGGFIAFGDGGGYFFTSASLLDSPQERRAQSKAGEAVALGELRLSPDGGVAAAPQPGRQDGLALASASDPAPKVGDLVLIDGVAFGAGKHSGRVRGVGAARLTMDPPPLSALMGAPVFNSSGKVIGIVCAPDSNGQEGPPVVSRVDAPARWAAIPYGTFRAQAAMLAQMNEQTRALKSVVSGIGGTLNRQKFSGALGQLVGTWQDQPKRSSKMQRQAHDDRFFSGLNGMLFLDIRQAEARRFNPYHMQQLLVQKQEREALAAQVKQRREALSSMSARLSGN